jgi:NitT/TauT family transport system substrate-binding protein
MKPSQKEKAMALKKIVSEVSGIEHSFPYFVARDEGYFAEEGLEIELVQAEDGLAKARATRNFDLVEDHRLVNSFQGGGGQAFESGQASLYRACEWGQVRRSYDSSVGAQVSFKRSNMGTQAIVVRADSPYHIPQDLADVPIGVNMHHGSHYVAIQSLEGFLEPHEIKMVNGGGPAKRFEDLRQGRVDAIAIMEPWVTVSEKLGYKIIVEAHYAGLEIVSPDLDHETFAAVNRAISKAARKLTLNPYPYLHYLIELIPPEIVTLTPSDFNRNRLRFVDPAPYSQKDFERSYRWMVKWGLIGDDAGFEKLVDARFDHATKRLAEATIAG